MGTTDTELLDAAKKIVQNTEPKTSTQIVVGKFRSGFDDFYII